MLAMQPALRWTKQVFSIIVTDTCAIHHVQVVKDLLEEDFVFFLANKMMKSGKDRAM